jgi:hypothetical protein|tara:strand:- start:2052 stop:2660 length:609 start_codon:yes stop_codon:yes gene_type:complete
MRFALGLLAAVLVGLSIGGASALVLSGIWPRSTLPAGIAGTSIDGWRTDFAIGSDAADPYTRARVARHGLLALERREAIYFTRSRDERGRPLRQDCRYRLSGMGQAARWWSITLYDADSRLPMNTDQALSIDASEIGEGAWQAIIAPKRPEGAGHWLSSRNADNFDLTLRLYVPSAEVLETPKLALNPPRISRLGCTMAQGS